MLRITEVPLKQWRVVLDVAREHIAGGNALHLEVQGTRMVHMGSVDDTEASFGTLAKPEIVDVEFVHHRGVVTVRAVAPAYEHRVVPVYQLLSKSVLLSLGLVQRDFTPKMSKTW